MKSNSISVYRSQTLHTESHSDGSADSAETMRTQDFMVTGIPGFSNRTDLLPQEDFLFESLSASNNPPNSLAFQESLTRTQQSRRKTQFFLKLLQFVPIISLIIILIHHAENLKQLELLSYKLDRAELKVEDLETENNHLQDLMKRIRQITGSGLD